MTLPNVQSKWLALAQTQRLFDVLGEKHLRAVGGCVRDSLRNVSVTDVDMATSLGPEKVMEKLHHAGIKVIPTGLKYGSVTAILDGFHYEITTLRQDIETDGRHATVGFGSDWSADATRRDFTINALYCDRNGRVYDPLGQGVADLMAGKVVFIGDGDARIKEDYLRVLRFFRFHYVIGKGAVDGVGFKACRKAAQDGTGLAQLSGERLQQEFFKILLGENAPAALEMMQKAGVLAYILPFLQSGAPLRDACFKRLETLINFEMQVAPPIAHLGVHPNVLLRLACLLTNDEYQIDTISAHLRLSRKQKKYLLALLTNSYVTKEITSQNTKQVAYWLGGDICADLMMLQQAMRLSVPTQIDVFSSHIKEVRACSVPVFPYSAKMIQAVGVSPGPEMGRLLKALEGWWVENDFPCDEGLLHIQLQQQLNKSS